MERKYFEEVERVLSIDFPGVLLIVMGMLITAEVFARLLFNYSFQGLVDLTENFVLVLVFFSLSGVQTSRAHISVDILPLKLKNYKAGPLLDSIQLLTGILGMLVISYEMAWYTCQAYKGNSTTTTLYMPIWIFALIMTIGTLLMIIRMVLQFKMNLFKIIPSKVKMGGKVK